MTRRPARCARSRRGALMGTCSWRGASTSPLTGGTIESRPPGLDQPLDAAAAALRRARLAGAVVDPEGVLEIAEHARGMPLGATGRPRGGDRTERGRVGKGGGETG